MGTTSARLFHCTLRFAELGQLKLIVHSERNEPSEDTRSVLL